MLTGPPMLSVSLLASGAPDLPGFFSKFGGMMSKLPFETEIRRMLERMYPLVVRPVDVRGERFTVQKKADFFCMDGRGCFVVVECKATRSGIFAFSKIPEHQRDTLNQVTSTQHGKAYLALNLRGPKGPGGAWLIPWVWWCGFETKWPKKSIRLDEAIEHFSQWELLRIPAGWSWTLGEGKKDRRGKTD